MGAHDFQTTLRGENDLNKAYRLACEEAEYEHGHDAYNGTISTTSGAVAVTRTPVTMREAQKLINKFWDGYNGNPAPDWQRTFGRLGISKWDNCGAIPLKSEGPPQDRQQRTKKVTLDAVEYAAFKALPWSERQEFFAEHLKVLKGYELTDVHVDEFKGEFTTKVETKATDGERDTRYFIVKTSHPTYSLNPTTNYYSSQSEARAALEKQMKNYTGSLDTSEMGIVALTVRDDASPLVKSKVIIKKAVLPVTYTMVKYGKATNTQDGWLFFGLAAC